MPAPVAKKRRTRGSGTKGGTHGGRLRAGGAQGPTRTARLQERSYRKGQVVQTSFSIERDGSATSTGWQGSAPPKLAQERILELYESGQINAFLSSFFPIACTRLALPFKTLHFAQAAPQPCKAYPAS